MPQEFDPAWEYHVVDPEIQWIFDRSGAVEGFDGLTDDRLYKADCSGIRYGKGNPNRFSGKLAKEKPPRIRDDFVSVPDWIACETCGVHFHPSRNGRRFCSRLCIPRSGDPYVVGGRPRILENRKCKECGNVFRPIYGEQVFDSYECAMKQIGKQKSNAHDELLERCRERFEQMWVNGCSVLAIAREMGIAKPTANRWRKRLGLRPRPSGNHSNSPRGGK